MDSHVVGVLGGGQLGRMLVEAASRLNIKVAVLDAENAPAKQINAVANDLHVNGSFAKAADVEKLAANSDVITYEIEHVDTKILEELEEKQATIPGTQWNRIQPSWRTVNCGRTSEPQGLKEIADKLGYPLMLKSRTEAYDGRGNYPVKTVSDIEPALKALADRPLYAEQWCNFTKELAVMVVKTSQDASKDYESSTIAYPTVETIHEDSICKLVYAPAREVPRKTLKAAQDLARRAVSTFTGTGVFGVELFLLPDDTLLINEIAPRPHNSGHYTIEACHMSQYEAQVRAVLPDLAPTIVPGSTDLAVPAAIMLNILGGPQPDSHLLVARQAATIPGARVHLYGKGAGRPGRKMGHITLTGSSISDCETRIHPLIQLVDALRANRTNASADHSLLISSAADLLKANPVPKPTPIIAVVMGSDTDLATLKPGSNSSTTWPSPTSSPSPPHTARHNTCSTSASPLRREA
ncbi:phosphoribosylaminoimidazole carboxylase [Cyphellophora attinorum]|uniref:Phosphoribosylaminoimidazole carboxylase n=1 Tax=Cyphellophora attinorum TaxID=1664694 RepID=A0A0N0NLZ8_9EURO|nr:phosphoribosylaminoimidazole carboxylase [Phialophora attinorum]KPI39881.1 phosphoribosylaminoimidazole carboxylase [Phialophora attinorum]